MNTSLVLLCCVLTFAVFAEAEPVRGGWASGATSDRDPEETKYKNQGSAESWYKQQGQVAEATADGDNPKVYTYTAKQGGSKASVATASGNSAVSYASAK